MKRILGFLFLLSLAGAFFGLFFFDTKLNNTSIVEDLPVLPVAEAGLCTSNTFFDQADFSSSSCIQPIFDFYIVHVSDDNPLLGLTLAQKVQRTKDAFNVAKTKWAEAWTANQIPPVTLTANFNVLVPSGTQVTVPGVNPIYIPQQHLTFNYTDACANPHKICYVKEDISTYLGGDTSGITGQLRKLSYRERSTNSASTVSGIGLLETTLKHNSNIPVLIVDKMTWIGSIRAGFSDVQYGVISMSYLGFQNYDLGIFNQDAYNRVLTHEIGHMLGLGEDESEPTNLMTQMSHGGTGYSLGLYQAARAKASLCSPGLRPEKIGVIQNLASGNFVPSCANDRLLHTIPSLDEQCNPGFSGATVASQFTSATIQQKFCPIVTIGGTVLPTPLAVTDDPSSPHFYATVIQNNPGAQLKMCNVTTCQCEGLTGTPGTPPIPMPRRPFVPQDTVPVPPGGNGGPYSVPTAPSKPTNCSSYPSSGPGTNSCPATAWCPPDTHCTAGWTSCACVPNACGNGQLDAGEQCDGSAQNGNTCPFGGGCFFDCTCGTVQPGE